MGSVALCPNIFNVIIVITFICRLRWGWWQGWWRSDLWHIRKGGLRWKGTILQATVNWKDLRQEQGQVNRQDGGDCTLPFPPFSCGKQPICSDSYMSTYCFTSSIAFANRSSFPSSSSLETLPSTTNPQIYQIKPSKPKGPHCTRCATTSMSMPYPKSLFSPQSRCSQASLGSSGPSSKMTCAILSSSSAHGTSEGSSCAVQAILSNRANERALGPWAGWAGASNDVLREDLWGGVVLCVTPYCDWCFPLVVSVSQNGLGTLTIRLWLTLVSSN